MILSRLHAVLQWALCHAAWWVIDRLDRSCGHRDRVVTRRPESR